ncbi:class I lanthipeptide [Chryseobacterium gregarium]|uniref:class I lanthipeptide n=1 Tax=Chryseobacterium gregarium TaxID=456299 RepID=UPI000483C74D|nr:class I lanthipeptide [Chryseobacterium gregarium]
MKQKLTLNKERITKLTAEQSASIQGGGSAGSTNRGFTCCMCTGGDQNTYNSFDRCPPGNDTKPVDGLTPIYQSEQNQGIC